MQPNRTPTQPRRLPVDESSGIACDPTPRDYHGHVAVSQPEATAFAQASASMAAALATLQVTLLRELARQLRADGTPQRHTLRVEASSDQLEAAARELRWAPPTVQTRRHWYADFVDTSNAAATSIADFPSANICAACCRTCSRRCRHSSNANTRCGELLVT
jgi:hypothetical protein